MKDIYKLLAEKRRQLDLLQREVNALTTAANLLRGEEPSLDGVLQSQPQMAVALLEANGKPMHVRIIAEQIKKKFKKTVKKNNLGVMLYRYAQRGKHFYKVPGKPNTYGLLKWQAIPGQQEESRVVQ